MSVASVAEVSGYAVVVAYDPGGTTGWSVFAVHPDALSCVDVSVLENVEHWAHGQFSGGENAQADEMVALALAWPDAALVVEDFILRTANRSRDVLSPVRLRAKFEYGLHLARDPRRLYTQSASDAKSTCTDDRLKAWKFYEREGGLEHARDADRHALLFLRRAKERSGLRAAAWVHLYGGG